MQTYVMVGFNDNLDTEAIPLDEGEWYSKKEVDTLVFEALRLAQKGESVIPLLSPHLVLERQPLYPDPST